VIGKDVLSRSGKAVANLEKYLTERFVTECKRESISGINKEISLLSVSIYKRYEQSGAVG
jgi:hypothetical protein